MGCTTHISELCTFNGFSHLRWYPRNPTAINNSQRKIKNKLCARLLRANVHVTHTYRTKRRNRVFFLFSGFCAPFSKNQSSGMKRVSRMVLHWLRWRISIHLIGIYSYKYIIIYSAKCYASPCAKMINHPCRKIKWFLTFKNVHFRIIKSDRACTSYIYPDVFLFIVHV